MLYRVRFPYAYINIAALLVPAPPDSTKKRIAQSDINASAIKTILNFFISFHPFDFIFTNKKRNSYFSKNFFLVFYSIF